MCEMRADLYKWNVGDGVSVAASVVGAHLKQLDAQQSLFTSEVPSETYCRLTWACQPHKVIPKLVAAARSAGQVFESAVENWKLLHRVLSIVGNLFQHDCNNTTALYQGFKRPLLNSMKTPRTMEDRPIG